MEALGVGVAPEGHVRRPARDLQRPGGRQEIGVRVLGADARLDRVAVDLQVVLGQRHRLAGGHAQLPLDEVQPGDRLGHRVLDLQPGVHLHEVEAQIAVVALLGDEFDGAGADVADRLGRRHRRRAHLGAARLAHARRRRFLQHLLVAPLHRAVALEEVQAVAVGVGEDLDLDVARARDVALDQHMVVAEARLRLALARGQRGGEVGCGVDAAHALAATAGAGLDQHRVADLVGLARQQRRVVVLAVVARHQRHAGLVHQRLGGGLAAHRRDRLGRRADEDQAGLGAGLGKGLVLAQEAVAGVDGLRAAGLGRVEDALPLQITLARGAGADVHGLVAGLHMARVGVGVRVDGDGAHAQACSRGGNAAGDLAAVGNQDLLEHAGFLQAVAGLRRPTTRRHSARTNLNRNTVSATAAITASASAT